MVDATLLLTEEDVAKKQSIRIYSSPAQKARG